MNRLCGVILLVLVISLNTGCQSRSDQESSLTSIHILDRNGFSETISADERLLQMEMNDFCQAQPYQKVTRTFHKTPSGKVPSIVTTYHPNGSLWQILEALDGRAFGKYREFFASGQMRLEAHVIEGEGDIHAHSQEDWVFNGASKAWNSDGILIAEINYQKGLLEGPSKYYHSNEQLAKIVPYRRGQIHGVISFYDKLGNLYGTETYKNGQQDGVTQFEETAESPSYRETYEMGKLMQAVYFDKSGLPIGEIRDGIGEKLAFLADQKLEKTEYHHGYPEGKVRMYNQKNRLESEYTVSNGMKHGEEWFYYPNSSKNPKMMITWYNDKIHGPVKTWYENGAIESEKEMSNNLRHGHSFAWYLDGSLMLIENYEKNKLVKGSYLQKQNKDPISTVKAGNGIATLHDSKGYFLKTIEYQKGRPIE